MRRTTVLINMQMFVIKTVVVQYEIIKKENLEEVF